MYITRHTYKLVPFNLTAERWHASIGAFAIFHSSPYHHCLHQKFRKLDFSLFIIFHRKTITARNLLDQ